MTTIKKLPKVGKLFRLLDFHIYDDIPPEMDHISLSSDDSGVNHSPSLLKEEINNIKNNNNYFEFEKQKLKIQEQAEYIHNLLSCIK